MAALTSSSLTKTNPSALPVSRAQQIRKAQEEALLKFERGGLYIALFLRSDPPKPNDYHWAFYHHYPTSSHPGGAKHHITDGVPTWYPQHDREGHIFKGLFLCTIVHIGRMPEGSEAQADAVFRSLDLEVNDRDKHPQMTCRVWLFKVVRELVKADLLKCSDVDALMQECFDAGNEHSLSAAANEQPRPVVRAKTCN